MADKNFIVKNGITVKGPSTFDSSVNVSGIITQANLPVATQAYVATQIASKDNTDEITEGSSNLYHTTSRVDSAFDVRIATKSTTNLGEGNNLYYTTARADSDAKNAISLTDAGGDGSFAYVPATGVLTYTGPSVAEVRAKLVASTGITYDSAAGKISITNTGVTAGTYGSGSLVPKFTVNAQGLIDSAGVFPVAGVASFGYDSSNGILTIGTADGGTFTATATLGPFTTANLTEGSSLYYTTARADSAFDVRIATKTTTNLGEGNNLYHTTARADSDAKNAISGGTGITYNNSTGVITTTDGDIVHDSLSGFVANEHIDHSGVSVIAGTGLTGGGTIAANRTLNVIAGTGLTANADNITTNDGEIVHDNLSGFVANEHIDHTGVTITAGAGLTGGGTIAATRTLNVIAGTGITVNADNVTTNDGEIVHDNLSGFVGNEHIDHSGVSVTAGAGLTGGGTIAATRTLNIGAGTGVTVNANDIAIGQAVATTDDVTFDVITATSIAPGFLDYSGIVPAHAEGRVFYDSAFGALAVYNDEAAMTLQVGQEQVTRVYNGSGATVLDGKPVYYVGVQGTTPTIGLADGSNADHYEVAGLATHDIENGTYGYVTNSGLVNNIDTSSLTANAAVFLGASAGALSSTENSFPNFPITVGRVLTSHASTGQILVELSHDTTQTFRTIGDAHIGTNLVVGNNLTVLGTQVNASTQNINIGGAFSNLNQGDTIGDANTALVTGSGLDDAVLKGHFTDIVNRAFYLAIDSADSAGDSFKFSYDSAFATVLGENIRINDSAHTLANGISVEFGALTGHTLNNAWLGSASPINVDTGIFTNRNTGSSGIGHTHMGLFFDVSETKWTFLNAYDSDVSGTINMADSSVTLGIVKAGTFEGALTGELTGNAATATILATPRTIGGVSFNGSAAINLPGVNTAGNQNTSGTAAIGTAITATANNTANETVFPTFVDGATGTQGIETDTGLTYNPSSGVLTSLVSAVTEQRFLDSNASNYVGFGQPVSPSANVIWTLPNADGSAGQALVTSGTKTLSWAAAGAVTTADESSNTNFTIKFDAATSGAVTAIKHDTGLTYNPSTGKITATNFTGEVTGNAATATALATARTIGGTSFDGTANIAVNLSATATALATARTIGGTSFDGTANIAVDLANTATTLANARTIGGVSFNGGANINLPGVNSAGNQNTSGSAATLTTARTIGGVSFNGGANINLAGVNATGNQNTSGSAATLTTARTIGGTSFNGSANIAVALANTATTLANARTIGGVSFNGSANINLAGVNATGNQNTSGSAATLTTARTIGGTSFNGSANIAVNLSATATALATARTIGGTSFDGTANIAVATATTSSKVTLTADNSTNATNFPIFVGAATGDRPTRTDTGFTYNPSSGTLTIVNLAASGTVDGRDVAADGTKLDGIESNATADQSAAQILTALRTVDVNGTSGVNAGTLDGQAASHYRINVYNAAGSLLN